MSVMHPSDEDLSAHLDGEAPEVAAHVEGCAACRSRLDQLRAASTSVAVPPPAPDPAVRDTAIAAALGRPSGPSRRLVVLAAVAAIVVIAGIATPLLLRGGGTRHTATAFGTGRKSSSNVAAGDAQSAAPSNAVDGGDLGDQSDPDALSSLVSRTLNPPQDALAATSGGQVASGSAGASASPAPTTTVECTPPSGGTVVYRARLRWKGTAAQVFAIEPGRRLVVMDSARCQVLVDRHF